MGSTSPRSSLSSDADGDLEESEARIPPAREDEGPAPEDDTEDEARLSGDAPVVPAIVALKAPSEVPKTTDTSADKESFPYPDGACA